MLLVLVHELPPSILYIQLLAPLAFHDTVAVVGVTLLTVRLVGAAVLITATLTLLLAVQPLLEDVTVYVVALETVGVMVAPEAPVLHEYVGELMLDAVNVAVEPTHTEAGASIDTGCGVASIVAIQPGLSTEPSVCQYTVIVPLVAIWVAGIDVPFTAFKSTVPEAPPS